MVNNIITLPEVVHSVSLDYSHSSAQCDPSPPIAGPDMPAAGDIPEGHLGGRPDGHCGVHVQGLRERGTESAGQLHQDSGDAAGPGTQWQ